MPNTSQLQTAYIFLGGFYDERYYAFYEQQIKDAKKYSHVIICADGGLNIFQIINERFTLALSPDIVIGDLDSVGEHAGLMADFVKKGSHFVEEWIGNITKDYTDGQLAVAYAMQECGCMNIVMFGGLNDTRYYESDHFLGNLKLMRFGFHKIAAEDKSYRACMRDALQEIHFIVDSITLQRKGNEINRVSLMTEYQNTVVSESHNLRWVLNDFRIDPDEPNAIRNEFLMDANTASIILHPDSKPVYVIHNWS